MTQVLATGSVWLAFFLMAVLKRFAPIAQAPPRHR